MVRALDAGGQRSRPAQQGSQSPKVGSYSQVHSHPLRNFLKYHVEFFTPSSHVIETWLSLPHMAPTWQPFRNSRSICTWQDDLSKFPQDSPEFAQRDHVQESRAGGSEEGAAGQKGLLRVCETGSTCSRTVTQPCAGNTQ